MAVLLHALVFSSLLVVIDFTDRNRPVVPLAIKGTIVTEVPVAAPPQVVEKPPPPEPAVDEQERIEAERQKLLEDQRAEEQRLHRLAEEKRKADEEAERKRKADEERRRKEAEAEQERKRQEAERLRQEEIERQRRENERLKAEVEAARLAELEADSQQVEAMAATAEAAYMFAIRQRVMNRWVRPPTATVGVECIAHITQVPGGEVISVRIGRCNGDATVRQSIENAIHRASPLPVPEDPSVFSREITLEFRPKDD